RLEPICGFEWRGVDAHVELMEAPPRHARHRPKTRRDGDWHPISVAPFGRDLQLAVIDYGAHALLFPRTLLLKVGSPPRFDNVATIAAPSNQIRAVHSCSCSRSARRGGSAPM